MCVNELYLLSKNSIWSSSLLMEMALKPWVGDTSCSRLPVAKQCSKLVFPAPSRPNTSTWVPAVLGCTTQRTNMHYFTEIIAWRESKAASHVTLTHRKRRILLQEVHKINQKQFIWSMHHAQKCKCCMQIYFEWIFLINSNVTL